MCVCVCVCVCVCLLCVCVCVLTSCDKSDLNVSVQDEVCVLTLSTLSMLGNGAQPGCE